MMSDAPERKCVKMRTLKRGRVYCTRGVETIAVMETMIRGIRVQYTGVFDIDPENEVESGHYENTE